MSLLGDDIGESTIAIFQSSWDIGMTQLANCNAFCEATILGECFLDSPSNLGVIGDFQCSDLWMLRFSTRATPDST